MGLTYSGGLLRKLGPESWALAALSSLLGLLLGHLLSGSSLLSGTVFPAGAALSAETGAWVAFPPEGPPESCPASGWRRYGALSGPCTLCGLSSSGVMAALAMEHRCEVRLATDTASGAADCQHAFLPFFVILERLVP